MKFIISDLTHIPENERILQLCHEVGIQNLAEAAKLYLDTARHTNLNGNFGLKLSPMSFDQPVKRLVAKIVIDNALTVYPSFDIQTGVKWGILKVPVYTHFRRVWDAGAYKEDIEICLQIIDDLKKK